MSQVLHDGYDCECFSLRKLHGGAGWTGPNVTSLNLARSIGEVLGKRVNSSPTSIPTY